MGVRHLDNNYLHGSRGFTRIFSLYSENHENNEKDGNLLYCLHGSSLYSENNENDEIYENILYYLHGSSLYSENNEKDERNENFLLGIAMNGMGSLLQH